MNTVYRHLIVIVFFLVVSMTWPVYGQEQIGSSDDWEIRLIPYFWMPEVDADAVVSGLSGSIDLGFDDIVDHLDFAAMGRMEAWKNKWGLTFDSVFMNLGADKSFEGASGVTNFDLNVDARLGIVDFGLAYHMFEQQFGDNNEQKLTFEPYGGLRYAYLRQKIGLNVNIAGVGSTGQTIGGSEDWVEPFIGGRFRWDLNDKLALNFGGDAGGFGIGSASDLLWQIAFGVDYKLSKNTSLNVGYRIVDLDYSRGSSTNEFSVDLQAKGPIIGMTILF